MVIFANTIGLVIRNPQSVFTNGCVQQAVFLKQLIVSLGYPCDYIGIEENFQNFPITNEPIKFIDKNSKLSNYKLFIFVSLHLNPKNDTDIINTIKTHNIKCVNLVCGNLYILHQEEFVFDKHHILHAHDFDTIYDEYWVLEMYPFLPDYITLLTGKPSYILPYIWNDTIINLHANSLNIETDYHEISRSKINILIYEPNMSIHKTAFVPILIAENYQRKYGDKLNKVYVFCGLNVIKNSNNDFIQKLEIYKTQKLEAYDRMIMPNSIYLIKQNNNFINVVISHNIMNNLNFLHLEMMTLDIPIIHNCEPFKDNQLYYDDFSCCKAIDMVEWVRTDFYKNSDYISNSYSVKHRFHPQTFERQEIYKNHIERITNIFIQDDKTNTLGITIPLIDNFVKVIDIIYKQPHFDNTLFYTGKGISILLSHSYEYTLLEDTLKNMNNVNNNLPVEIVCNDVMTPITDVKQIIQKYKFGFKIDILNLGENHQNITGPNMFMGIVFSNFEKGIIIKPGVLFINHQPVHLIDKYIHEEANSLIYYPSHEKSNYLDTIDQNIFNKICQNLNIETYSFDQVYINCSGVIFFNKMDTNCLKVLGSMCELIKLNRHVSCNVNIINIVCDLIYNNNKSKLNKQCNLYGYMDSVFNGLGVYYSDPNTKEIEICVLQCPISQSKNKKMITIDCNEKDLKIHKDTSDPYFKFSGKFAAKKIPKKLNICLQ